MMSLRLIIALILVSIAGPMLACSAVQQGPWDRRIKAGDTCSFERAGEGKWGIGRGEVAVDHGNGIVSQLLEFGRDGCSTHEMMLVHDCKSMEAVIFDGQGPRPDENGEILMIAGASYSYVANIVAPVGPLELSQNSTVTELVKTAKAARITFNRDVEGFLQSRKRKNRPDLDCGCNTFYPENAGNSQ